MVAPSGTFIKGLNPREIVGDKVVDGENEWAHCIDGHEERTGWHISVPKMRRDADGTPHFDHGFEARSDAYGEIRVYGDGSIFATSVLGVPEFLKAHGLPVPEWAHSIARQ